ncbi:hypothetical protein TNCV_2559081 [Trichonephila clavipes]|nr:hypothetical protein TNCV_2559081 [Trichonephila clavipes]
MDDFSLLVVTSQISGQALYLGGVGRGRCPPYGVPLDTLRENCGIIRKQASTDGGVLWKVVRVNVVQVRRKDRSLRDPREARSRVRV